MRFGIALGFVACAAAWAQPAPPAPPEPPATAQLRVMALSGSYLGIGVQEISSERAKALNMKEERGAEVTSVEENSPASKAGIKEHDVVLEYNGQAVQGTEQFSRLVRETPADRQVKLVVWRNGKNETITATVGARNNSPSAWRSGAAGQMVSVPQLNITIPDIPRMQLNYQNPRLGIEGEALGGQSQFAEFLGVKEGVLVKSVTKDSAAEKAGIKAGDVVVKVDDASVKTTTDITSKLRTVNKSTFSVTVVRNKKETQLNVTIESAARTRGSVRSVRVVRPARV